MTFSDYIPLCDALVLLMRPLVGVALHDIKHNRIVYINDLFSQRKVGDASLLDLEKLNDIDKIVYQKITFDGLLIKSISIILEKQWLLCINCDVSVFSKMMDLSQSMLNNNIDDQPKSLFTNDWQEKVHVSIHSYVQNHHMSFDHLTNADKKKIAQYLFDLKAFNEKNAANYIAKILNLSRATVFKYLKEWRKK